MKLPTFIEEYNSDSYFWIIIEDIRRIPNDQIGKIAAFLVFRIAQDLFLNVSVHDPVSVYQEHLVRLVRL